MRSVGKRNQRNAWGGKLKSWEWIIFNPAQHWKSAAKLLKENMGNHSENEKIIEEMVRKIVDRVKPEKIILFGSYARGTAGPDSDVDLIVVLSIGKNSRREKVAEIYRLLGGMGLPKDIIVVSPEDLVNYRDLPGTIIRPALQEGRVLYDRAA